MATDSILTTIKRRLGPEEEYDHFDPDIIMEINTAFFTLMQLGVGPKNGYHIVDKENVWSEFLNGREDLYAVETYIYQKVRLVFDPPQTSFLLDAIKNNISELEWRFEHQMEVGDKT